MNAPLSIERVNGLSRTEFVETFGDIYEHSRWVAEKAYDAGPFHDRDALETAMRGVVDRSAPSERREILRKHPQLSGQAARRGTPPGRRSNPAPVSEQPVAEQRQGRRTQAQVDRLH